MTPKKKFRAIDLGIAAGGALAFAAGFRRLAGAIFLGGGVYELSKGHKIAGPAAMLGGASFLIDPDWIGELVAKAKSPINKPVLGEGSKPPVYNVSLRQGSFDEDIGGGWVMLDARSERVRQFDTDKDVHVGNVASLLLQSGGVTSKTPVKVFNAKILGITGDDFAGQWVGGAPSSGPQMIDFRGAHIFDFH